MAILQVRLSTRFTVRCLVLSPKMVIDMALHHRSLFNLTLVSQPSASLLHHLMSPAAKLHLSNSGIALTEWLPNRT
jgi:hypothetical protein